MRKELVERLGSEKLLQQKLNEKLEELGDIISKEGALCILCREYGIGEAHVDRPSQEIVPIASLNPETSPSFVTIQGVITLATGVKFSKDNRPYRICTIDDKSGRTATLMFWGSETDLADKYFAKRCIFRNMHLKWWPEDNPRPQLRMAKYSMILLSSESKPGKLA